MKFKSVQVDPKRVKAGPQDDLKEGEFLVYPSTFTREPDAYGDVVAKGAFAETIKAWAESGNTLPGLFGHRLDDPDFYVASATEMGEDEHGWWVKGQFDMDSPKGKQTYRLVKGRRLTKLSFAFDVEDEGEVELADGRKANELRKLNVHEFSFVPVPANSDATVMAVKSGVAALKADLSADSVAALREARDSIDSVLASLDEEDEGDAPASDDDQEKQASGESEAKPGASDEEPSGAKSPVPGEEPKSASSVARLAAQATIYALNGQEGVPS